MLACHGTHLVVVQPQLFQIHKAVKAPDHLDLLASQMQFRTSLDVLRIVHGKLCAWIAHHAAQVLKRELTVTNRAMGHGDGGRKSQKLEIQFRTQPHSHRARSVASSTPRPPATDEATRTHSSQLHGRGQGVRKHGTLRTRSKLLTDKVLQPQRCTNDQQSPPHSHVLDRRSFPVQHCVSHAQRLHRWYFRDAQHTFRN